MAKVIEIKNSIKKANVGEVIEQVKGAETVHLGNFPPTAQIGAQKMDELINAFSNVKTLIIDGVGINAEPRNIGYFEKLLQSSKEITTLAIGFFWKKDYCAALAKTLNNKELLPNLKSFVTKEFTEDMAFHISKLLFDRGIQTALEPVPIKAENVKQDDFEAQISVKEIGHGQVIGAAAGAPSGPAFEDCDLT